MPAPKPLSKGQILEAMDKTKSNRAAARYLGVSYIHYKRWAQQYKDEELGTSLFVKHLNPHGKGIPKFLPNSQKQPALMDVIEGRIDVSHFKPQKIKYRLIHEGLLKEECACCEFKERRIADYKIPLILHFKDKNKKNYKLNNIQLLCYNCYFLTVGDVFNDKDILQLEDNTSVSGTTEAIEFELDDFHLERLKQLGLWDSTPQVEDSDGSEFISRL